MYPPRPAAGGGGSKTLPIVIIIVLAIAGFLVWKVKDKDGKGPSPSPTQSTSTPTGTSSPPRTTSTPTTPATSETPGELPTVPGATTDVRMDEVVICSNVTGEGAPVDPVQSYGPTDTFYVSLKAFGLVNGTKLVAHWMGPGGYSQDAELISDKVGDYFAWFKLEPKRGPWPVGSWSVALLADGVLQKTVSFEVKGADAGGVVNATTCRNVDSDYRPVDATAVFSPSEIFYCSVQVKEMTRGQVVKTGWYEGSRHLNDIEIKLKSSGSGFLSFKLLPPDDETWTPGDDYRVDVYVDGDKVKTVTFSVEE